MRDVRQLCVVFAQLAFDDACPERDDSTYLDTLEICCRLRKLAKGEMNWFELDEGDKVYFQCLGFAGRNGLYPEAAIAIQHCVEAVEDLSA